MPKARTVAGLLKIAIVSALLCRPAGAAPAPADNAKPPTQAELTAAALKSVLRDLDPLHGRIDQSTPENTARSFVNALNSGNAEAALDCILYVPPNDDARELARWFVGQAGGSASNVVGLHSYPADDSPDSVTVTFRLDGYHFNLFGESVVSDGATSERLHLKLVNNLWRIVPPMTVSNVDTERRDILASAAALLAHPAALARYKDKSLAVSCESQLKQLAMAMSVYVNGNNGIYSFDNATVRGLVFNDAARLLNCPGDKSGAVSYSFNNALTGKKSTDLAALDQTVELYEGHDGKLDFRHEGKADVCFADGHVAMIDETEAKALRWQP